MVGAQKGAFRSAVFIFLLFFIVLHDDLSPAFAPYKAFLSLLKSIYVYKINKLDILLLVSGLLKSTIVYQHLPTNDGITVGSFGSIEIDTNKGRGIYGSY